MGDGAIGAHARGDQDSLLRSTRHRLAGEFDTAPQGCIGLLRRSPLGHEPGPRHLIAGGDDDLGTGVDEVTMGGDDGIGIIGQYACRPQWARDVPVECLEVRCQSTVDRDGSRSNQGIEGLAAQR